MALELSVVCLGSASGMDVDAAFDCLALGKEMVGNVPCPSYCVAFSRR